MRMKTLYRADESKSKTTPHADESNLYDIFYICLWMAATHGSEYGLLIIWDG